MIFRVFFLPAIIFLFLTQITFAQTILVLRFLDNDEGAIIKTADGKTKTIKVGDVIKSTEFKVQSTKSEIQSTEYKVQSSGANKESSEFRVQSAESNKESAEFKVQSSELRVIEISEGRIVFEERTNKGLETVIIRVENGKQKIERISKVPESKPITYGREMK